MQKTMTTIKISKNTVSLLNALKIHHRQSYEEVILELLKKRGAKDAGDKR